MVDLEVIKGELEFTVPLLIQFPKCYWLWNHRLWVLNEATKRLPTAAARKVWETELGLVGKMLDKDRRNFHAWGYRRFVVANLEDPQLGGSSMVEAEFEYSTKMVLANLSNFSAWHNRSQLIPRLLAERGADDETRKAFLEKGTVISLNFEPRGLTRIFSRACLHPRRLECRPGGSISLVLPTVPHLQPPG
jgi:geranylgeranyl transferase type-2 subunit alpha